MLERGILLALLVVVAGCLAPPAAPPGATDRPAEGAVVLTVRVVGLDGAPMEAVDVFVVGTDLKDPVDNLGFFEAVRDETRRTTGADGLAEFELGPGTWVVAAEAPGHYRNRHVVGLLDEDVEVEIVLPTRDGPTVVAHRGGAQYAPENTFAAFRKALALGADVIEFDVQLTADDILVVIHDFTLDRTTNGSGAVRDHTADHVTRLDAGSKFHPAFAGERVPTFEQVLEFLGPTEVRLFVDVKATPEVVPDAIQRTAEVLRNWNLTDRAFVASFHVTALEFCQAEGDLYCLLMMGADRTEEEAILAFKSLQPDGFRVRHDRLTTAIRDEVEAAGKDLFTGAPNAPHDWHRVVTLGVDYIGTDRPGDLLEYLAEDAVWRRAQVPS